MAQKLDVDYAEGAFAAGLFHDLGWLLVALGCPDEFKQISLLCRQGERWASEYEMEVLGVSHADLSAEGLAAWNLPEPIQAAVRFHRNPALDPARNGEHVPLSAIINIADQYLEGMGSSVSVYETDRSEVPDLPDTLGLGDRLPLILEQFQSEFSSLKPYF
jgi:HD-like signal output (HDOD) protein